jgi:hypothetical protein
MVVLERIRATIGSQKLDHVDVNRVEGDTRRLSCAECGSQLAGPYYVVTYSTWEDAGPFGDIGEYHLCPGHASELLAALATSAR